MKKSIALILLLILFLYATAVAEEIRTVTFSSSDGLPITADLYLKHRNKHTPFIVLFHQAGWSRGEYLEIAPKLTTMGFNCLAVDLRSGGKVNAVVNQTAANAVAAGKPTAYIDALKDVKTALRYTRDTLTDGKIVAWGSSYSASLVLKAVGENPGLADSIVAFSPGEYFTKQGKPADWIKSSAKKINKPTFITSAREEKKSWIAIFRAIPTAKKIFYVPRTSGQHGSRALWKKFSDSSGYWQAVGGFLDSNFKS